ncbi:MAG: histidine--tRNA ligase [Chloroflexi bacterium]|nr:histidine--tRNA ligase [Chloroflexota bacterium]
MKSKIQSVKGTRDFYPEQMAFRTWLYGKVREVSERFGYQEWEAPFLETLDLYAAKSGEELVKQQAFVFQDRGGDEITLRPELTPSLARLVAARQAQLGKPIRWWSFGPFWRYERPQKGRSREFFQWNIDLLGPDNPEADAEMAAIGATFFRAVGLEAGEVKIQVNNRKLLERKVEELGVRGEVAAVFKLIDKRDKMSAEAWEGYATETVGLSAEQLSGLKDILSNRELWRESESLVRFFENVKALGVAEYIEYEPTIVRGLDYYTGTVFEARDRDGEFRAILGGGRYDNLVDAVGGDPLPATGFAMGDMVISLVIEKYGKKPALAVSPTQVLVTLFDEKGAADALGLARDLRAAGLNTEIYPQAAKLDRQLKYADGKGIRLVAILGPEEAAAGAVSLKDLAARSQRRVPRAEIAEEIRRSLDSGRGS